jgi:uncharacterized damage-inducible protein DinB
MPISCIDLLLALLDQGYDHRSWHGPNLRGALRGVTPETAVWRPGEGRHNIWEQAVHAAYWKYTIRRRLRGEKRGSFPLVGSDWFTRPDGDSSTKAWQRDLDLLEETHRTLRAAVAELGPGDLERASSGSGMTNLQLISGVAAHDVYHAGQVRLLRRLAGS